MADNINDSSEDVSLPFFSDLIDMGFSPEQVKKALTATGGESLHAAMDWLLQNPSTSGKQQQAADVNPAFDVGPSCMPVCGQGDVPVAVARSLQCDRCQKLFRSSEEVEFHAVKTGHSAFSESGDEVKPLTEEEKKEQIKKIEALIKERRAVKEELERKEAIQREKSRRKLGQEMAEARQRLEEQEIKRLAEVARREKAEARLARQKVLKDIEQDKQARRERLNVDASPAASPPSEKSQAPQARDYDSCRLQIRLTNGDILKQTFSANEELAAVRLFVQLNRTDGENDFSLMTSFPRRVFTDEDMSTPLRALDLAPSAVLIVSGVIVE